MQDRRPLTRIVTAPGFLHALTRLERLSVCDAMVLIFGGPGTARVARGIHCRSVRPDQPVVPIHS